MLNDMIKQDATLNFIKLAIENQIKLAIEEEFEKARSRIDERKYEIVAGVLLHIKQQIDINSLGESITFTIKRDSSI